jgi:hypothetical protein
VGFFVLPALFLCSDSQPCIIAYAQSTWLCHTSTLLNSPGVKSPAGGPVVQGFKSFIHLWYRLIHNNLNDSSLSHRYDRYLIIGSKWNPPGHTYFRSGVSPKQKWKCVLQYFADDSS